MSSNRWLAVLIVSTGVALSVGSPHPWSGAAFIVELMVLLLAGSWLPIIAPMWIPVHTVATGANTWKGPFGGVSWCALAAVGGLAVAFVAWFLSFLLVKAAWPGTVILLAAAATQVVMFRRLIPWRASFPSSSVWLATCCVIIGLLHFGANEVQWNDSVYFFSPNSDPQYHAYATELISTYGLPVVDLTGTEASRYSPLYHVGVSVVGAGLEHFSQTSTLQIFRHLWIWAYWLIAWSLYAVVATRWKERSVAAAIVSFSPLCWGGAIWLADALLVVTGNQPFEAASFWSPFESWLVVPSAFMYRNVTLIVAIAIAAGGLIPLNYYLTEGDADKAMRRRWLFAAATAFSLSGLVKPSTLVLFGPALFVMLLLRRENWRCWAVAIVPIAGGLFFYSLPSLIYPLPPPRESWQFELSFARLATVGVGHVALVVTSLGAIGLIKWRASARSLGIDAFLFVAVLGGLAFVGMFRPTGTGSINPYWPLLGAMVAAAPFIVVATVELAALVSKLASGAARSVGRLLVGFNAALIAMSLLVGVIHLSSYPWSLIDFDSELQWRVPAGLLAVAHRAGESSGPEGVFIVDPELLDTKVPLYLQRRVLWYRFGQSSVDEKINAWKTALKDRRLPDAKFFDGYSAVLLHGSHELIISGLKSRGWEARGLTAEWSLLLRDQPETEHRR